MSSNIIPDRYLLSDLNILFVSILSIKFALCSLLYILYIGLLYYTPILYSYIKFIAAFESLSLQPLDGAAKATNSMMEIGFDDSPPCPYLRTCNTRLPYFTLPVRTYGPVAHDTRWGTVCKNIVYYQTDVLPLAPILFNNQMSPYFSIYTNARHKRSM